ncbi:MAG TPA: hypothetical protein VIJ51_16825 [Solirubrobacteraceae bacterium]
MSRSRPLASHRLVLFVLVGLLSLLGLPGIRTVATAVASPTVSMRLLYGNAFTALMTDGGRYAAFEPVEGTTRVIDATTGTSVDRPDPAGCEGGLVGVGAGELLYSCVPAGCVGPVLGPPSAGVVTISCTAPPTTAYARVLYVVEDIAGGRLHVVAGSDRISPGAGGEYPAFDEIGSEWLSSPFSGLHVDLTLYLNWHTGQQLTDDSEPKSAARSTEDLDAPKLLRTICAPLRRTAQSGVDASSETTAAFVGLTYSPPFAASIDGQGGRLALSRCGSSRVARLRGTGVTDFQLAGGAISWGTASREIPGQPSVDEPGVIYAAALHTTGRHWLATTFRYTGAPAGVVGHTMRALYDSTPSGGTRYSDIYTAALRR